MRRSVSQSAAMPTAFTIRERDRGPSGRRWPRPCGTVHPCSSFFISKRFWRRAARSGSQSPSYDSFHYFKGPQSPKQRVENESFRQDTAWSETQQVRKALWLRDSQGSGINKESIRSGTVSDTERPPALPCRPLSLHPWSTAAVVEQSQSVGNESASPLRRGLRNTALSDWSWNRASRSRSSPAMSM